MRTALVSTTDFHLKLMCQDWPDSCNLNLYESGDHSVGWHSDGEFLFQGTVVEDSWDQQGETVIPVPYFATRILGHPIFADSILIFSDFSSLILLVVMPASRLPHSVLGWFSPVVTGKFQDCLIISLSLGAPRCFELKVRVLALPRFWVFESWIPRLMIWLPYGKTWKHTILNMHMVYKSVLLSIHYTCAISYIVMLNNQRVPADMSRRTCGWFPARRCASRCRCSVWCCMEDG